SVPASHVPTASPASLEVSGDGAAIRQWLRLALQRWWRSMYGLGMFLLALTVIRVALAVQGNMLPPYSVQGNMIFTDSPIGEYVQGIGSLILILSIIPALRVPP